MSAKEAGEHFLKIQWATKPAKLVCDNECSLPSSVWVNIGRRLLTGNAMKDKGVL